jgi:hypothetical protein
MKNVIVFFILLSQLQVQGQAINQSKVLEDAVMQFNQTNSPNAYKQLFLQFEQLYSLDKTNWLIPYYAGMTKSIMCLLKMGDRDALANDALRWFSYEGKIKNALSLAKKLNPNNPRAYILEANIQQKLPFIFGGGCKSAKPFIQKAELCMNTQTKVISVEPSWGMQSLVKLKKACPF